MAKILPEITDDLKAFIADQKIFYVGTAMAEGHVNVSPKGMDTLKVIDSKKVVWLNLTGSGNETATHLLHYNRLTIMFCAFDGKPLILRLYGKAMVYHEKDAGFQDHIDLFAPHVGARQIILMEIDMVQSSCGFAVPLMEYKKERSQLTAWANNRGRDRVKAYQQENNAISLDGYDTGLPK
jgi:hypothetical protein